MIIVNALIKHVNNKQQRGDLKLWLATQRVIFTTEHESKVPRALGCPGAWSCSKYCGVGPER